MRICFGDGDVIINNTDNLYRKHCFLFKIELYDSCDKAERIAFDKIFKKYGY